ncbi:MAG: hypothetical protein LBV46_01990, partial [Bacteroidales bacterium]|nr:hypothetical protein [Bacteroidales bacterium]
TPIPEFNLAFGIGLPLRSFSTNASINIMVEYGQMGVTKNDLIRQDVLKLTVSFSLQEKWYQRVKLD